MTWTRLEPAICCNKLCDYQGHVTLEQNEPFDEKQLCPKCGFKTLGDNFRHFLDSQFRLNNELVKPLLDSLEELYEG